MVFQIPVDPMNKIKEICNLQKIHNNPILLVAGNEDDGIYEDPSSF